MLIRDATSLVRRTTAIAVAAAVFAASAAAAGRSGSSAELLPDLDQQAPSGLMIANANPHGPARYLLGFESAVDNTGEGELLIVGRRASLRTKAMRAQQIIDRADGSRRTIRADARLRYAVSPDHQHWHLLHFDRYELRRVGAASSGAVVRDQKTGFCLGDRYRVASQHVPNAPVLPRYTDRCGLAQPKLVTVTEGISPGYGDNYQPYLEGQSLPLTGLTDGRYVLTHRANPDRALRESDFANNAASVLLDLRWEDARPVVHVLASCPDSADCEEDTARVARANAKRRPIPHGMTSANWNPKRLVGANWALCGVGGLAGA
jgi:Lysyl oxidase